MGNKITSHTDKEQNLEKSKHQEFSDNSRRSKELKKEDLLTETKNKEDQSNTIACSGTDGISEDGVLSCTEEKKQFFREQKHARNGGVLVIGDFRDNMVLHDNSNGMLAPHLRHKSLKSVGLDEMSKGKYRVIVVPKSHQKMPKKIDVSVTPKETQSIRKRSADDDSIMDSSFSVDETYFLPYAVEFNSDYFEKMEQMLNININSSEEFSGNKFKISIVNLVVNIFDLKLQIWKIMLLHWRTKMSMARSYMK